MRHRRTVLGMIAVLLVVAAGGAYNRVQQSRQRTPTPIPVALEATTALPMPSVPGWKPVPVQVTPGVPRVVPLTDDPVARTRSCGSWDSQATAKDGWLQRECVGRLALAEQRSPTVGAGVFITKMRWEMAAATYAVPRNPGPSADAWVIVVRFDYPDSGSVAIIIDDSTGAPYLRVDNS